MTESSEGVPRIALYFVSFLLIAMAVGMVAAVARTPRIDATSLRQSRPSMVIVPAGIWKGQGDEPDTPVASFAIAETEVTQGQWTVMMGSNPSYFNQERGGSKDHPVERVSWFDALEYLNRLSASEGFKQCYDLTACTGTPGGGCTEADVPKIEGITVSGCTGAYRCSIVPEVQPDCDGYRLPTEVEWLYAARAEQDEFIPPGRSLSDVAWFDENSGQSTHPVGSLESNMWRLRDVLGNVYEWTATFTDADNDRAVLRGCAWRDFAALCRAAQLYYFSPGSRSISVGFRPARSIPQP
ncbi:MAG: formylglycine-generating enzyme family protein [Myxococcota bacterium]